jgi:hypothetical protein
VKRLAFMGLIDAHVRIVRAQPDVTHMAEQVALRVLRSRPSDVHAKTIKSDGG